MADIDLTQAVALAALISRSVQQLVDAHAATKPADTDGDAAADAAARAPVLQIVAATAQLAALVRAPEQAVMEAATGYHLSAALRLVVEANIVEIIRARGAPALHVDELGRLAGVDASKLARLLRLLATHHIFREAAPDTFANNRLSIALDSGAALEDILPASAPAPIPEPGVEEKETGEDAARLRRWEKKYGASAPGAGLAALIGVTTDESMRHATALSDTLLSPPAGGAAAATHPLGAPFSRAVPGATALTMFDWLSARGRAHRLLRFGCAMQGMGALTPAGAILAGFDWRALPPGSSVVDVGGGVGAASLPIVRANPGIRLEVQDTEKVVEVAPKFWESHFPEALRDGRVSFQKQSFFDAQPARAAPPAVFLLRMIMHNWPDKECAAILRHVRAAAAPLDASGASGASGATLVVVDSILMYACRGGAGKDEGEDEEGAGEGNGVEGEDEGAARPPEPLLANWGTANGLAYKLDIQMLNNHNAGERTLAEFARLLARTGWRVVRVHAASESWMPQIVAVPAPVPPPSPEAGAGAEPVAAPAPVAQPERAEGAAGAEEDAKKKAEDKKKAEEDKKKAEEDKKKAEEKAEEKEKEKEKAGKKGRRRSLWSRTVGQWASR